MNVYTYWIYDYRLRLRPTISVIWDYIQVLTMSPCVCFIRVWLKYVYLLVFNLSLSVWYYIWLKSTLTECLEKSNPTDFLLIQLMWKFSFILYCVNSLFKVMNFKGIIFLFFYTLHVVNRKRCAVWRLSIGFPNKWENSSTMRLVILPLVRLLFSFVLDK